MRGRTSCGATDTSDRTDRAWSATPDDLAHRFAVHQAAWPVTRVSERSCRAVWAAWPHQAGLGEADGVGTDARFRRLGLGRSVCLAALRALRAEGVREAVYPVAWTTGGEVGRWRRVGRHRPGSS